VAYGLADDAESAEDSAGYELLDDEADARGAAQWRVYPGVFRRTVTYGPWERVPDPQVCVRCCDPIEPGEAWTDRRAGPEHEDCPG
jgi:hypothetical protein